MRKCVAVLLLLCLLLCGCGGGVQPNTAAPVYRFTDDLGRTVNVASAKRVAALIGSFAEIWCLAGGRDSLVAAADDSWTSFDLGLDESVVNLGAVKTPSLEALLAAEPDFVIGSCNTEADIKLAEILDGAGIPTACFDVQSIDDYLRMLRVCTDLTGQPGCYEKYGTFVKIAVDAAIKRQDGSKPRILCMRATGSGCKVKGSEGFLLGEMLRDLGCVNVADQDGALLDSLSMEAIMAADPDYIFCVLQGSDSTAAQAALEKTLLRDPAWSSLRAVREGRFYTLEHSLYNLKPNAKWGVAYEKLADILYGKG